MYIHTPDHRAHAIQKQQLPPNYTQLACVFARITVETASASAQHILSRPRGSHLISRFSPVLRTQSYTPGAGRGITVRSGRRRWPASRSLPLPHPHLSVAVAGGRQSPHPPQ